MDHRDHTTEELDGPPEYDPRRAGGWPCPEKLSRLRLGLYQKAKGEPRFRFYALYDRIYRKDVLAMAFELVRRKKGAPGLDGVTIDEIVDSEGGRQQLMDELHEGLRTKRYRAYARLTRHLNRCRQRPFRPPKGVSLFVMLTADESCMPAMKCTGTPDAGNPHVRCDEGGSGPQGPPPLLYRFHLFGPGSKELTA